MFDSEGLTIPQAAEAMHVSAKTVRRYVKDGKLPFRRIEGKFGEEYRITQLPPEVPNPPDQDPTPPLNTPSTLTLPVIDELRNANKELQEKNLQLAGQLGATLERIRHLENQIKLLSTPKLPWWKRLLGRKS